MKNLRIPKRLSLNALSDPCRSLSSFTFEGNIEPAVDAFYTGQNAFVREILGISLESIDECTRYKERSWRGKVRVHFQSPSTRGHAGTLVVEDDGLGFNLEEILFELLPSIKKLLQSDHSNRDRGSDRVRRYSIGLLSVLMVAAKFTVVTCRSGLRGATAYKLEGDKSGQYVLSEMDEHYQGGSVLYFEIMGGLSESYTMESVQELMRHFIEHSRVPVEFKPRGRESICLSQNPFAWETPASKRLPGGVLLNSEREWRDFAFRKFQEPFSLCFPVRCEEWAVQGIACILEDPLGPLDLDHHFVYSRGRYVSREAEGLAPDFVRCILEINALELNACQEGFVGKNDCWEEISRTVREGLKKALTEIEMKDRAMFYKIGRTHEPSFRALAKDDGDPVFLRILQQTHSTGCADETSAKDDKVADTFYGFRGGKNGLGNTAVSDFAVSGEEQSDGIAEAGSDLLEINRILEMESWERRGAEIDTQIRISPADYADSSENNPAWMKTGYDGFLNGNDLLNFLYLQSDSNPPGFLEKLQAKDAPGTAGEKGFSLSDDPSIFRYRFASASSLLARAREERECHRRWLLFLRSLHAAIRDNAPEEREDVLALAVIYNIAGIHSRPLIRLFWPMFHEDFGHKVLQRKDRLQRHYLLWAAEKVLYYAPEFPQIPLQEIEEAREIWRSALTPLGSYKTEATVRMELHHALRLGMIAKATDSMEELQRVEEESDLRPSLGPAPGADLKVPGEASAQDFGCNSYARQIRTLYFCTVGDAAGGWRSARHDMDGRDACKLAFCSLAPRESTAALLEVLYDSDMRAEAEKAHQLGLAKVIGVPHAIGWLGYHLRYMVRKGAVVEAGKLLDEALLGLEGVAPHAEGTGRVPQFGPTPFHRLHFLRGAIAVMRSRADSIERIAPFENEAKQLAVEFDWRNLDVEFLLRNSALKFDLQNMVLKLLRRDSGELFSDLLQRPL